MSIPNKESAQKRIVELSEKINYHNYLYYQEDVAEISDFEFDQLMEELIKLENIFPDLKREDSPSERVGGTITKRFETAEHAVKMLSLGNTYSEEELLAFDERVAKGLGHGNYNYFCELKFDGVAISLVYEYGKLIRAVTRGDGYKGDVVTENVKTIRNIPLVIKDKEVPAYFEVRGEVFLPRKTFEKINLERESKKEPLLANPRNAASGTLKMQDSGVVAKRKLNCYLYQLIGNGTKVANHHEAISKLEKWGFNVSSTYQKCIDMSAVLEYIHTWKDKRHELPVETDGVVLKVNDHFQQEELGFTAKIPRWAIAYKYKAESAKTCLQSITYQVGRTGAITPVANLSPVSLAGTTVKRASLHNANEILRLNLHEGDQVWVEKGGEIIPKITQVVIDVRTPQSKPITYISNCPECGFLLERKEGEAKHFCPNATGCPPQVLGRIEHFVSKRAMDIDTLGTERLRALINQGYVKDPADLYELPERKSELLGLEISEDQYTKSSNGLLFISIKKALYAITENITLSEINRFLCLNESMELANRITLFEKLVKNKGKKVNENLDNVKRLGTLLAENSFDSIEDYIPLAAVLMVLANFDKQDKGRIINATVNRSSIHDLLIHTDLGIPAGLEGKINKLKGNTFQEGVLSNMIEGIKASVLQPFPRVLFALGIRNIGENTALLLADHFGNIDALRTSTDEELLEINGVGDTLVNSLRSFFASEVNIRIIDQLKKHGLQFESNEKEIKNKSNLLAGKKILASGKLNHFKREEIMDFIASHGGIYTKSVSKNLDFIIEGEEMGPSKKDKALKLGIRLISENDFLQIFA